MVVQVKCVSCPPAFQYETVNIYPARACAAGVKQSVCLSVVVAATQKSPDLEI